MPLSMTFIPVTMRHMIESMKQCEIVEPTVTIWGKLKETDKPALEALADAMLAE